MLKPEDKKIVVDILTESFSKNKSVNYIVKQDAKKERRIKLLMQYSVFCGELFGSVHISQDKQACAIILFPHLKKTTLSSILWDVKLVLRCIGLNRVFKALKQQKIIHKYHPKNIEIAHLWYIGVARKAQGKGSGTELMQEIFLKIKEPIYLETSIKKNIKFYERLGFDCYHTTSETNYKTFLFKKEKNE